MKINPIILFFLLLFSQLTIAAETNYFMYKGEIKTYEIDESVDRVAVGSGKMLSTSITNTGQLILVAEDKGDTNILIWLNNGELINLKVFVIEKDIHRVIRELQSAFVNVDNIKIKPIGELVQVYGTVNIEHKVLIDKLEENYNFINLVKYDYFGVSFNQFKKSLENISGLEIIQVSDMVIMKGYIKETDKPLVDAVVAAFKDIKILNLTQKAEVIKNKMIYMNVKIVEINTNDLDELGISWDSQVTGPNAFYSDGKGNGFPQSSIFQGSFYGLATEITSRINLLTSAGDAVLIAEPRLSSYSGGNAEFTAGGQLPIPVTGADGRTSVEYKNYGIILKVKPHADNLGNISAHVETEVSSIDQAVSVNGIPGIKTRNTSTDVFMKNQQTLVISGLINNEMSLDNNHVPILGQIPLFKYLFGSERFRNSQTQLVIFVTPTIYDANSKIDLDARKLEQTIERKFKSKMGLNEIVD